MDRMILWAPKIKVKWPSELYWSGHGNGHKQMDAVDNNNNNNNNAWPADNSMIWSDPIRFDSIWWPFSIFGLVREFYGQLCFSAAATTCRSNAQLAKIYYHLASTQIELKLSVGVIFGSLNIVLSSFSICLVLFSPSRIDWFNWPDKRRVWIKYKFII